MRSRLGGFVLLPRILDKGRATLAGKNGEYNYNSPTDQHLVRFLGLDLEALLITERDRFPHRAPHHANPGEDRPDLHLQVKEVPDRNAVADADVHVALIAQNRTDERLDVRVRQIEHVTVYEKEDIVSRVVDTEAHRVALAAVLAQSDGGDVKRARDLDRAVGRAVADDDDLVDETALGQNAQNLGDRLLFVVRRDDG